MQRSVIVWDLETVPDLRGFAAAHDLVGRPDAAGRWAAACAPPACRRGRYTDDAIDLCDVARDMPGDGAARDGGARTAQAEAEGGMKKMLLAGVTALSIASAAHAEPGGLPLTDPLIGNWCKVDVNAISPATYKRGVWTCDGSLLVEEDGYHDDGGYCTFADVQRLPSRDGYTVKCSPGDREYSDKEVEFRIIGGRMHYRELAPTDCRKVGEGMSDGFLNLREGPGMKYAVKAKLVPGDAIYVGEVTNGWARVSVPRFRGGQHGLFVGFVWNKHVVDNDGGCHVP